MEASSDKSEIISVGDLLSLSWDVYKKHLWSLLGILFLSYVLSMALLILMAVGGLVSGAFVFFSFGDEKSALPVAAIGVLVVAVLVFLILHMLIQVLSAAALIIAVRDREGGVEIIDSYKKAWPYLGSYLWTSILSGLAIVLGLIFFIVPGIILMIRFMFAPVVVLTEGLSGSKALARSGEYVKGRWWKIVGRLAVLWLIFWGIVLAMLFVLDPVLGETASSLLGNIALFVLSPLGVIYPYLLYENLKSLRSSVPTV